jgi:hypothetical protein
MEDSMKRIVLALALVAAFLGTWNCGGSSDDLLGRFAWVLENPGQLARVNLLTGQRVGSAIPLTGNLRNIALRPTDNQLFAMGTDLNIYTVNTTTGVCTLLSAAPLAVDGHNGGMTFEPDVNSIRFVSINQNNYRINAANGALAGQDTDSNEPVVGLGYRATSAEYVAYGQFEEVFKSVDIASGVFTLIGGSTLQLSGGAGFSIDNDFGVGYVCATEGIYRINLATGVGTQITQDGADDIAVIP